MYIMKTEVYRETYLSLWTGKRLLVAYLVVGLKSFSQLLEE